VTLAYIKPFVNPEATMGFPVLALVFVLFASSSHPQSLPVGPSAASRRTNRAPWPGVTVEAASPALIEKVRTAVADEDAGCRMLAGDGHLTIQRGSAGMIGGVRL
jgi:hypothetical protein